MSVEVKGVVFHPFHRRVLAGGVIPGAVMYECGCGRYGRHDRSQSSLNAKVDWIERRNDLLALT